MPITCDGRATTAREDTSLWEQGLPAMAILRALSLASQAPTEPGSYRNNSPGGLRNSGTFDHFDHFDHFDQAFRPYRFAGLL